MKSHYLTQVKTKVVLYNRVMKIKEQDQLVKIVQEFISTKDSQAYYDSIYGPDQPGVPYPEEITLFAALSQWFESQDRLNDIEDRLDFVHTVMEIIEEEVPVLLLALLARFNLLLTKLVVDDEFIEARNFEIVD